MVLHLHLLFLHLGCHFLAFSDVHRVDQHSGPSRFNAQLEPSDLLVRESKFVFHLIRHTIFQTVFYALVNLRLFNIGPDFRVSAADHL